MRIQITQEHLDQAREDDASGIRCEICPVAQALKPTYPNIWVSDFDATILIMNPDGSYRREKRFRLTPEAQSFIAQWDHGLPVSPCELEVWIDQ